MTLPALLALPLLASLTSGIVFVWKHERAKRRIKVALAAMEPMKIDDEVPEEWPPRRVLATSEEIPF